MAGMVGDYPAEDDIALLVVRRFPEPQIRWGHRLDTMLARARGVCRPARAEARTSGRPREPRADDRPQRQGYASEPPGPSSLEQAETAP